MAADLREMQENQGFSENLIDKLEFGTVLFYFNMSVLCLLHRRHRR